MSVIAPADARGPFMDLTLPPSTDPVDLVVLNRTNGRSLTIKLPASWSGDDLKLDFLGRTIVNQNGVDRSALLDLGDQSLWNADPLVAGPNDLVVMPIAGTVVAHDEFNQAAGALAGKTLPQGGTWQRYGLGATSMATTGTGKAQRTSTTNDGVDPNPILAGEMFGPDAITSLAGTEISLDHSGNSSNAWVELTPRYVHSLSYFLVQIHPTYLKVLKRVSGVYSNLYTLPLGSPLTFDAIGAVTYRSVIQVLTDGTWRLRVGQPGYPSMFACAGQDSDLATGGPLATGQPVFGESLLSPLGTKTRFYDNYQVRSLTPASYTATAKIYWQKAHY